MLVFYRILLSILIVTSIVSVDQISAGELTFELPDNEKMCFHEHVEKGVECVLEFQVRYLMCHIQFKPCDSSLMSRALFPTIQGF
jgi:hypothetical protein